MGLKVRIKKRLKNFTLDVDFETENGMFAILGASGCGKSMTLKCIAGIETPDEGLIVLNGKTLYDSSKKINLPPQKRKVGYMFQDYALFPNMTVSKNIEAGMGKSSNPEKVSEYILHFQLKEVENSYPAGLSGGQKQRTAMARMIAADPEVLLLDEPFSALDSFLRWELEQKMREILWNLDRPVIFVSHNRDEVYRLCNTVSCINQGKMEVIEPVREFFHNPKTRTAAELSGCKNISRAKRLDEYHVEALDWNLVLTIKENVLEEITAVGIRAHSFQASPTEGCDNFFACRNYQIIEEPFEWTVLFRLNPESKAMQWKVAKAERDRIEIPEGLWLDSSKILLLKK